MNLLDLLSWEEQQVLIQILIGFDMSEVAIINQCTVDEVDECRWKIVEKLEGVVCDVAI